jgi:hypothetical protein
MGSYSFAGMLKILDLTPPQTVEACCTGHQDASAEALEETYPKASIIHWNFPARDNRPELRVIWYEGGLRPPRPAGLTQEGDHFFRPGEANEGTMAAILPSTDGWRPVREDRPRSRASNFRVL